jgi:hypothetical protein
MADSADQAGNGMPSTAPPPSVSPASYYAEFWPENAIYGEQHGFPRAERAGSPLTSRPPTQECMVIAVGCYQAA